LWLFFRGRSALLTLNETGSNTLTLDPETETGSNTLTLDPETGSNLTLTAA
jgi:hypothetical protein